MGIYKSLLKIFIKYMLSIRCKMAVKEELKKLGLHFIVVDLGEVEIIEAHHQQKLDAPSGTAIKTAEMISKARTIKKNQLELKEIIPGARGARFEDINIHSIRLPGILARQQVIFGNTGETLNITHDSIDRSSFMPGIILSCERVINLKSLYYGLENLLD
jgi:4-hydroxy-tetrahydrodipicolinate reductase